MNKCIIPPCAARINAALFVRVHCLFDQEGTSSLRPTKRAESLKLPCGKSEQGPADQVERGGGTTKIKAMLRRTRER